MPQWTAEMISDLNGLLFEEFDYSQYEILCERLGIKDSWKKKVAKLSDGMKMKTMLAGVFARQTDLLLLDEPASPLDPLMRDELCNMIREYIETGNGYKSVFFSTHNVVDMESVTDYAIIMEQGRIVEQGFVEELKEQYILIKGEKEDAVKLKDILIGFLSRSCCGKCVGIWDS